MRNIMRKSIIVLTAFVVLTGWVIRDNVFANPPADLYDQVWRLINTKFVDQTDNGQDWARWRHKYDDKIQTNADAYIAINTMIASLNDPYTRFLDPKEFADETSSIKGSLKGIGIQIGIKDNNLVVIEPVTDSPADKAGLKAEDQILEINGVSTKGITIEKAADQIRGEIGTQVKLLVKRKNVPDNITFNVTRAEIEVKAVSTKPPIDTVVPNNIQYIRLTSFISKNASLEIRNILMSAKDKKGLILDLRSNPGGLLSNAVLMSRMFLQPNDIIVSTVDRYGYKETVRSYGGKITNKPLIVLVNKGSASASEIFSGAMKDNHRATIIGEQSFGKGLVQEINKLPYEAGVNITIQRYLTPSGADIHKKGITPDVVVKLTEDNVKNKDDVQLKEAIKILSKMTNGQTIAQE